jgi:nucleoside-diphosphate-sugar epimerase
MPDEATLIVTGATAAVGRALLEAIAVRGGSALALTRRAPPPWSPSVPGIAWRQGSLDEAGPGPVPGGSVLLSAGPLAALAGWLERERPPLARLVALSSTSLHVKRDSNDPAERALIATLADAESRVAAWCAARGVRWTILRPTLIVSARDGDALDWIARAGRRFGFVALPRASHGLRQPIAAADVAAAMLAALDRPEASGRAFDLPGGETLAYRDMVRRVLAARAPGARLVIVPDALFRSGARLVRRHPALAALTPAVIGRMAEDLVFDGTAAADALGLRFGLFDPGR